MSAGQEANAEVDREEFVRLLTNEQSSLFGYIVMLIGDVDEASNVLQQSNMVLWRRASEFVMGSNFHVWARKVAYFQTLAYLRDRKRDKHIFDEELLEQLAVRPVVVDEDERRVALRHCLAGISDDCLEILRLRYGPGKSISDIASERHKSEGAIKMALMRIRHALFQCIEAQLQAHNE